MARVLHARLKTGTVETFDGADFVSLSFVDGVAEVDDPTPALRRLPVSLLLGPEVDGEQVDVEHPVGLPDPADKSPKARNPRRGAKEQNKS